MAGHFEPLSGRRHGAQSGKRFEEPVDVDFAVVGLEPGRRPGPDVEPRGPQVPFTG